jgi:seryl-tRNA synthetase
LIDLKLLEREFEATAAALRRRGVTDESIATLQATSTALKGAKQEAEALQAEQNRLSRRFGELKKSGEPVDALTKELADLKKTIARAQETLRTEQERLEELVLSIPNLPDADLPEGLDEEDNKLIKTVGPVPEFDFTPLPHYELGSRLGWLDFERGAKISGSRFTVMRSEAARLERALISYMLDFNLARGFEEVWVPALINRRALLGTGQLPKFEEDLYLAESKEVAENDLFLAPTAEVPLINLYQDEIIAEAELPLKLTAHTPCFRKEAGSAGRDTRGMIRQHQFDKVEIVALAHPDASDRLFEEMVQCASDLLSSLELPHRLMQLCTGDMGFAAARTVDLEVWLPSEGRYREISSVSNTRDFQPRRARIRYKDQNKKNRFVHALNGSSLAVGRTLIALMENGQQKDGQIRLPQALERYLS